jgi:multidrug efflux pump subunit AcrA (membrane-fusion protein)
MAVAQRQSNVVKLPEAQAPRPPNKLELLVALEGAIREQPNAAALGLHAVNAPRQLVEFEQAFLFRANKRKKYTLEAASDVTSLSKHAPLCKALVRFVNARAGVLDKGQPALAQPAAFDLSKLKTKEPYPHPAGLWVPLLDGKKQVFGGLLFAKAQAWTDKDVPIPERVAQAYAMAFRVFTPPKMLFNWSMPRWLLPLMAGTIAALALVPVQLTTLGSFEVVAAKPTVATAPLDGVIAAVAVTPGQKVQASDVIYSFDVTTLRAEAEIAAKKVQVANSKLVTSQQGAFTDPEAKRNLLVAEKELELAQTEHDYAVEVLAKAQVKAGRDGLAIFSSVNDLKGKPVRVGEKIMEIADPAQVTYRVSLPVHDAIPLSEGSNAKFFLDADPLNPRQAMLTEISFHAKPEASGIMSYQIEARSEEAEPPRIGLRGTAQLTGESVSLGFYLLRRPIAALRQHFGM